jgi:hypothetical protein
MASTLPQVALDPEDRRQLQRAGRKSRESVQERDELIRAKAAKGATYREIAEAVGLSHTAVMFIVRGRTR